MANFREKVTFMSPLKEYEQEGQDFDDHENSVSANGCDCFGFFHFKTRRQSGEGKYLLQDGEYREARWNEKLNRVKEVSELYAGPQWKNFIRKVGRLCSFKSNKHHKFQYDPQSYALNFDGGVDREDVAFAS